MQAGEKGNTAYLHKIQRNLNGSTLVEVAKQVVLESGQILNFNLDGKSFYTDVNKLYKLFH